MRDQQSGRKAREMACEQRGAAKTAAGATKDYPLLRDSQTDGMEQGESAGRVMTSRCDHAAIFSPGLSLLTIISLKQRAKAATTNDAQMAKPSRPLTVWHVKGACTTLSPMQAH